MFQIKLGSEGIANGRTYGGGEVFTVIFVKDRFVVHGLIDCLLLSEAI